MKQKYREDVSLFRASHERSKERRCESMRYENSIAASMIQKFFILLHFHGFWRDGGKTFPPSNTDFNSVKFFNIERTIKTKTEVQSAMMTNWLISTTNFAKREIIRSVPQKRDRHRVKIIINNNSIKQVTRSLSYKWTQSIDETNKSWLLVASIVTHVNATIDSIIL